MLKLKDFKIKEIQTLETIRGGGALTPGAPGSQGQDGAPGGLPTPKHQCAEMTNEYVNFLGWPVQTGSHGDIHDD